MRRPQGKSSAIPIKKLPSHQRDESRYSRVTTSNLLNLTAFDQVTAETLKLLGSQAGRTSDTVTRDVLCAGTSVIYAGGAASRTALKEANTLKIADIKKFL